jgi:BASS family bile acid:Na+ symporter
MRRAIDTFTNLFPVWVAAGAAIALLRPSLVTWFQGSYIVWGLAVIMLGMGITLSLDDFRAVARMPRAVAAGFVAQFTIMPLMGWFAAKLFGLPTSLAVGVILVACCPGGTASNVVAYLARANVALSVLMTMCSTVAAVAMTPLLTATIAGTLVPVDAAGLFVSTLQVVLLPLAIGLALHHLTPKLVEVVLPVAPLVSVVVIALICASIIGQSADSFLQSGTRLIGAVALLHGGGFALGYIAARAIGYDAIVARTISIEVGMQNSGLGAVLARRHFADPLTALPAALSATMHSVIGSVLAGIWRRQRPPGNTGKNVD